MEPVDLRSLEEAPYSWIEVDRERCDKCGTCVDICPMDVLYLGSSGHPYMRFRDDCWYCGYCVFLCPRQAIKMDKLPYLIR